MSSNSCTTPYAGSCRDCMKVNRSESLTGRFRSLRGQDLGDGISLDGNMNVRMLVGIVISKGMWSLRFTSSHV